MQSNGVSAVTAYSAHKEWAKRPTTHEIGATREDVLDVATDRLDLSRKQASEAYAFAEMNEPNPRSVWGYVQGLTRLSQRSPWQDSRFALDRAASRLLTTVH
jgi:pyridoxine/pyridoxamine 5'-phosphate oxidase